MTPEELAGLFHESYERLAPEFGYKTREASSVPWEDVPENNKKLMVATATAVMAEIGFGFREGMDVVCVSPYHENGECWFEPGERGVLKKSETQTVGRPAVYDLYVYDEKGQVKTWLGELEQGALWACFRPEST